MLRFLPAPLRGTIATALLVCNTLVLCWPLFIGALFKFALPFAAARRRINRLMHWSAEAWIALNKWWMDAVGRTRWDVQGLQSIHLDHSYLVTSNHQSWVDILVLQYQLNRRAPFLKFFLKHQLIWVPVIGLCWWALEFPFMKRFSSEYLQRHPEKRGQDMLTTRKACERYRNHAVSVFNFLEGTRNTASKHAAQNSPFRYLLRPRAGGIAFVLDAMGEQMASMLNVTIHYPDGIPTFWELLCGRIPRIVVRFEQIAIPAQFIGRSYDQDEDYRLGFQQWVNRLWQDKDSLLRELHTAYPPAR
ncbi:MAG: acyltransferase [Gammaproteobacteria bacterium]|jgi:1-acyl-sn-glycerol-3-phosphate acyltransferase|nr:acyltransferase [Gammaproteobacteria bacterium]MBP6051039.1 acyltransferase [Pseudomonadales bacterium]MBK6582546.1 acyltransferase [Gammaproteobacteria bacterium]MBK7169690.1 acyltransferase [Gammaproteobacteria bacterium]MBK7521188.1 acyltransferase [Gammaproteobacteria bacterium]